MIGGEASADVGSCPSDASGTVGEWGFPKKSESALSEGSDGILVRRDFPRRAAREWSRLGRKPLRDINDSNAAVSDSLGDSGEIRESKVSSVSL